MLELKNLLHRTLVAIGPSWRVASLDANWVIADMGAEHPKRRS